MKEKMKLYGYSLPSPDEMKIQAERDKQMPRMVANQKAANDAKQDFEKMRLAQLLKKNPAAAPKPANVAAMEKQ